MLQKGKDVEIITRKFYIFLLVFVLMGLLLVWSPWLTDAYAGAKAIKSFKIINENTQDGCSLECQNCGVNKINWKPFGRSVLIEYNCGGLVKSKEEHIDNHSTTVFVSFMGNSKVNNFE